MEKPSFTSTWRAAVDIGAAFTSACAYVEDSGEVFNVKVPSAPGEPASGVLEALAGLCGKSGLSLDNLGMVMLGSTFFHHAIASGRGPIAALLVTKGFRDILSTGWGLLPHPCNPWEGKVLPPVSRRLTFEINERILPGGRVVAPLADDEVVNLIPDLKKHGVESVAVCFLHSYGNPLHEQRVKDILARQIPGIPVTLSSDILPSAGEYGRAYAAAVNAAVRPLLTGCLNGLKSRLTGSGKKTSGIFVLQSDGSAVSSGRAPEESTHTDPSGPMGGVLACLKIAKSTGRSNLITLDLGATGARLSILCRNQPGSAAPETLNGYSRGFNIQEVLTVPLGAESAVHAGGDSLNIHFDIPGPSPGPARRSAGGILPTCTDANLLLGRINPLRFQSGLFPHDTGKAREAIDKNIAGPLGLPAERAALNIIKNFNDILAGAIKIISIRRGHDPREFTLVAFGSAGPLHAAELAKKSGIPRVLVPPYPGTFSARGMLYTDLRREYTAGLNSLLAYTSPELINSMFDRLEEAARLELTGEGVNPDRIAISRSAGIKYRGYPYEINMQFPSGRLKQADLMLLSRAFKINHQSELGLPPDGADAEIATLRVAAVVNLSADVKDPREINLSGRKEAAHAEPVGTRQVFFHDIPVDTPVFHRSDLKPFTYIIGPALVDQDDSATVIWPGMSATTDALGNIVINVEVK